VEVHWGKTGQVYITSVADDCVCIAFITRNQRQDRAGFLADYPAVAAKVKDAPLLSRERRAISATRKLRCVGNGSVALVGDASGLVDAITGEGLALSFRQALALETLLRVAIWPSIRRCIARLQGCLTRRPNSCSAWTDGRSLSVAD
jgi:hypothetical protein